MVAVGLTACAGIAGLGDYAEGEDSAGGSGQGGGAGTGGNSGSEVVCTDGLDDEGDGDVDCADADCEGFGCVPAVPDDFEGPVLAQVGPQATSCGVGMQVIQGGIGMPNVPAASCEACSCNSSGGCSVDFTTHNAGACSSPAQLVVGDTGCTDIVVADASSFEVSPAISTFQCAAVGGTPTLPAPTWAEHVTACLLPSGGGCGADVCVAEDMLTERCVYAAGDVPCPTGAYSERYLVESVASDDRQCGACTCASSGVSCLGSLAVHPAPDCAGVPVTIAVPNVCQTPQVPMTIQSLQYQPLGTGTCAASGGEPEGSLTTETVTLCCLGSAP
jgi:hypothetical protein